MNVAGVGAGSANLSLIDVVATDEEHGGDKARLEQAHLHGLLSKLKEDHGRSAGDAGKDFRGGSLGPVELWDVYWYKHYICVETMRG